MSNATIEEDNEWTNEKDVDDLGGMMTATNEDYYEEGSIDFSATAQMEELAGEFNVSKDEQSLDANLDDW